MSEMVERVAKALGGPSWNQHSEMWRENARLLARAAIEAMREPSAAMIEEGYGEACELNRGDQPTPEETPACIWRAMITAALA